MNVPLSWLADYVALPKNTKELTDKLTMVGHMLDKTTQRGKQTVIDLELRGNRADMFGLIGVAREVSAILNLPLKLPKIAMLPKEDNHSKLIQVEKTAENLVKRFMAIRQKVKIGPSPKWLIDRLALYGTPSINNVVDVTNYVMLETGIPMHAFDYHKIAGGQLVLRRGKNGEEFQTIQQGLSVKLSDQDLVVGEALMMIGGQNSKITPTTTEIILEAAVYDSGSCRRSARRLKIFTEAGIRLEKHLDPNAVEFALARAVYLIKGEIVGHVSDYYPKMVKPKSIKFDEREIFRLSGLEVNSWKKILESLDFKVGDFVIVPTFRTDIESPADLVEEIVRIYGYDKIPEIPISDAIPIPQTYSTFAFSEKLRDILTSIGLDEVITLTMVDRGDIPLVNPPDPELKWLRTNIHSGLIKQAKKLQDLRQTQVGLFEIGNTFTGSSNKPHEHTQLALVVSENLNGVLHTIERLLGMESLAFESGIENGIYWAEIDVAKINPQFVNPYSVISQFPPIIEDFNIQYSGNYSQMVNKIKKISSLIKQIDLIDKYEDKLTLRITYHDSKRQLKSADIAPIREKLDNLG